MLLEVWLISCCLNKALATFTVSCESACLMVYLISAQHFHVMRVRPKSRVIDAPTSTLVASCIAVENVVDERVLLHETLKQDHCFSEQFSIARCSIFS